jgi:hypothetical protein
VDKGGRVLREMTEGRIVKTQQNPLFLDSIGWVQVDVNPYWRCLLISGSKVRALVRPLVEKALKSALRST